MKTEYDGQPQQQAQGKVGDYMVGLTAEGCRLVCFHVGSDEIAGSLSPVPTVAEAQATAQALEDLNMTVNAYLIDLLTDHTVKGIMDEIVAAKLRGESVDYDEVRRRIDRMVHRLKECRRPHDHDSGADHGP
jgi:DNA transposition AAA+ family ATPase